MKEVVHRVTLALGMHLGIRFWHVNNLCNLIASCCMKLERIGGVNALGWRKAVKTEFNIRPSPATFSQPWVTH